MYINKNQNSNLLRKLIPIDLDIYQIFDIKFPRFNMLQPSQIGDRLKFKEDHQYIYLIFKKSNLYFYIDNIINQLARDIFELDLMMQRYLRLFLKNIIIHINFRFYLRRI